MKDLDQLKQTWQKINITTGDANIDLTEKISATEGKKRKHNRKDAIFTVKERMIWQLTRPLYAVIPCLCLIITLFRDFNMPLWYTIIYCGFLVLAAFLSRYQVRRLRNADFTSFTTIEAINFIKRFTIVRQRIKIVLISLAVPIIVILMWIFESHNEPDMLLGGLIGAVLGGFIGIHINRRFKKELRKMEEILGTDDESIPD